MCGICGVMSLDSGGVRQDPLLLNRMVQTLHHRGPDDYGYYIDEQIMLGMRRLSIIDLHTGKQPISNEDGTIRLVFNGEIYNYRELRDQLEKKGHIFRTKSDTEIIVHAYEEFEERCIEKFNGMFAFALWDSSCRRLLLARDRLGIKPLYYWVNHNQIVFGSELKSVITHPEAPDEIDFTALDQFLALEYIPGPRTIYKNIKRLPPGHFLTVRDGEFEINKYWDISISDIPKDDVACIENLTDLISDSVRMRMVSDVPLGSFLSGGIDSSTVLAFMCQHSTEAVKTFSIGFDDQSYNELPEAQEVANFFNTDHYSQVIHPDIVSLATKLIDHLDEPFADFSIFPTYLVSDLASRQVKVILSGDGGDEIFGGYDTYIAQWLTRYYQWLPNTLRERTIPAIAGWLPPQPAKKGLINKTKRWVEGVGLPDELQHVRWMIFMSNEEKALLYKPELKTQIESGSTTILLRGYFQQASLYDQLAQQQYVDIKTYLVDDILTKVDRMSMAASLEARVPMLDHRIVEFVLSLPPRMRMRLGKTKVILRQMMAGKLPKAVLNKPKQGFSIPMKHWLRGPLKPMMMDLLSFDTVQQRGYFEPQIVQRWITEHLEGKANHSHHLWELMVFELWSRQSRRQTH